MNPLTLLKKLVAKPMDQPELAVRDPLGQMDLAFVVDTTGSMGPFIESARRHMTAMLRTVTAAAATPIDLQVGLVEYRDHPPQARTFVAREHGFMRDLGRMEKTIQGLRPDEGGDAPEAVYDGLQAAADRLAWRPHSRRTAILIGDAPPHGWSRRGDPWGECRCGLSLNAVTALLEEKGVVLFALALTAEVDPCFAWLARGTGGAAYRGDDAIPAIEALLAREFSDLDFDRRVLDHWRQDPDAGTDQRAEALASPPGRVAASLSRLGRRGLLLERKPGDEQSAFGC